MGVHVTAVRRLLAVVAGVLPPPLSESARGLVAEHLDGDAAQRAAGGRAVTGTAVWARNGCGSRWAVVALFTSADGDGRWYLWDVESLSGCEVVTVYNGFYPSADDALAEWQQAIGPSAAEAA
jgi:hypothetical protein